MPLLENVSLNALRDELPRAIARRADLLQRLHDEGTDCYRLLHGVAEGAPGVTIDRYGSLLLVQTFRDSLDGAAIDMVQQIVHTALGQDLAIVCNHRGDTPQVGTAHTASATALAETVCHERGVKFAISARHRGQDPWLFLDLRSGRAAVQAAAKGKRVLNLFAYTCGVGIVAAAGGATRVLNVDFAKSALELGNQNARLNSIPGGRCSTLHSDCLPVLRQLAGMPVQRRNKHVSFVRIEREPFDLIVLDPPRFAKGAFGTIDVVNDYQSLFKPALLALAEGGTIVATNHVPTVTTEVWHEALKRCALKAGRPLRDLEPIAVDADFPSFDGQPPLKIAAARL